MKYSDEDLILAVKNSTSKAEVCRRLVLAYNGLNCKRIKQDVDRLCLETSHFLLGGQATRKYPLIDKRCPVCGKTFSVGKGQPREKTTCSYACSNTHFRSGKNNPNWKEAKDLTREESIYRRLCFDEYGHEEKCIICGWDASVDVHHVDGDRNNNGKYNLAPACPNHHRLAGMKKYKDGIRKQFEVLLNEYWKAD